MTTMESDIASRPVASKQAVKDDLVRQGFLPIYVHDDLDSRVLVEGAIEAGCRVLEYTCRRHDAREMIPPDYRSIAGGACGRPRRLRASMHRPNPTSPRPRAAPGLWKRTPRSG